jgi:hypothetical protein
MPKVYWDEEYDWDKVESLYDDVKDRWESKKAEREEHDCIMTRLKLEEEADKRLAELAFKKSDPIDIPKIRIQKNSKSFVPLFITWTVDPKLGLSYDFIIRSFAKKILSLNNCGLEYCISTVEHPQSNIHFHTCMKSSGKIRSEHLEWTCGKVNVQQAKGSKEECLTYMSKETPSFDCIISGAEALPKLISLINDYCK